MRDGCIDGPALAELFVPRASDPLRDEVERHLDRCGACLALVAAFTRACDDSEIDEPLPTLTGTGASCAAHSSARQPGDVLAERYVLDCVVGEGGMAVVWSAHDRIGDRRVALKVLKIGAAEIVRRTWREVQAAARVGHPSLVEVIDVLPPHAAGEPPVLVMPLLEGETLERLLARRQTLSERETLAVLEPVVAGMRVAHVRGVIHRDLKPSNIFVDDATEPCTSLVLDFGLAKILSEDGSDEGADKLTRTGALLGTPSYMAPEQLFGESGIDHRADVWAIGAMTYECLSGRRPISGRSYGQLARSAAREPIAPVTNFAPDVSPPLAAITSRMLDKDRDGRPPLEDVHVVLRSLLDR